MALPRMSVLQPLCERATAIVTSAQSLRSRCHPVTAGTIDELLRSMNSYYSNRIEGQSTSPVNIARALRRDFSDRPAIAARQRLAVAHIEAERALEERVRQGADPLRSDFLVEAHRELFARLPASDLVTGQAQVVEPGALRSKDVQVGRHTPPRADSLPAFLERLDAVYAKPAAPDLRLVHAAALHHRAAWVHPFIDGNGRAIRLQSHCALHALTGGLWSVCRGLARRREAYFERLAVADQHRRGDLDGRGNLTEQGLVEWIAFFLDVCEDQATFMGTMLDLAGFRARLRAYLAYEAGLQPRGPDRLRPEAELPLYHAFVAGEMPRADFVQMTGLGERTARGLLSVLIRRGLLVSDSRAGPVRMGFPLASLALLFPNLYPEAAASSDAGEDDGG